MKENGSQNDLRFRPLLLPEALRNMDPVVTSDNKNEKKTPVHQLRTPDPDGRSTKSDESLFFIQF